MATVILGVVMVSLAQLLAVTAQMQQLSRNSAEATRLAHMKFDELMKLNFATAAAVQISPANSLAANVPNFFDAPAGGVYTRRWRVQAGPVATIRQVTVRVVPLNRTRRNLKTVELTTFIRQW